MCVVEERGQVLDRRPTGRLHKLRKDRGFAGGRAGHCAMGASVATGSFVSVTHAASFKCGGRTTSSAGPHSQLGGRKPHELGRKNGGTPIGVSTLG